MWFWKPFQYQGKEPIQHKETMPVIIVKGCLARTERKRTGLIKTHLRTWNFQRNKMFLIYNKDREIAVLTIL
jgi:hypothetical protein